MIDDLKPYPAVKETGIPGLEHIPEHWKLRRLKTLFREVDDRTGTGTETLLSLRQQHGLVDHHALGGKPIAPEALIGFKRAQPGQIVMNRMRAAAGLFAVAPQVGIVSPDYAVLSPITSLVPAYFIHLFKTPAMMALFRTESRGLGTGQSGFLRLYTERFGMLSVPYPPADEQAAIVGFVEHAERRIRRYLRAKQKLVTLLNEQKQAIIQRAVTRGINPNVRLKSSGIEWLGDLPEHWTLKRFKFLAKISSGQIDPRDGRYRDRILIAPNHVESGTGIIQFQESADAQGADSGKYLVRRGQIVYSKIRPNLRKAIIAPFDCLCSADMYPITVDQAEILPEYCLLLMLSAPFTKYAVDCSLRVAMPKVNREALGECWFWYPDLAEQQTILHFLTATLRPTDVAIAATQHEIKLLHEHRTRLIADVATGKLDVRDAVEALPDLTRSEYTDQFDGTTDFDENADEPETEEAA